MIKIKLKTGDQVRVLAGDHKGSEGKISKLFKSKNLAIVEGVNMVKRHTRAQGPGQEGEIVEREAPVFASKVMLWDEENKKASRVGAKVLESGTKVRVFKTSGEQID